MHDPVFILGSHKSGTSLLRNLLDGVDGFFAIPIELHFFEYSGLWVDYPIRRSLPVNPGFDQVKRRILTAIEKSNQGASGSGKFGGDSLVKAGKWDIQHLIAHLDQYGKPAFEKKDLRGFIDVYVESVHLALRGELPPEGTRFVEKSVENAEFAALIKKLYPGAKFVHIVRNPYAALVSIRKFKPYKGKYPFLGTYIDALESSYYYAMQNPLFMPDYLVVRYEDLLTDPEGTMHKVADHLDTPFTPVMLKPSAMGDEWKGNSMSGVEFQGISTYPLEAWKSEITPLEIELVNTQLPHVMREYQYETIHASASPLLPIKREMIRIYLANRFYLAYARVRRTGEY
ncbi:MAG TPA: sulfotransferase [Anaerolineaceae bacterium]|nr:sulfotransferase [Anaerolineaceae bacterium]